MFGNPEEIFARMVDGLYSLELEKSTFYRIRPNEEDLDLLNKMTIDGEPAFEKGVERYKVALKMVNQDSRVKKM